MNEQRIWRWGILCVAALAVGGLWQAAAPKAGANAVVQSATASRVAIIDVALVLEQLTERTDRENELKAAIAERQQRVDKLREELEIITAGLEALEPGTARYDAAIEEAVRKNMEVEFEQNFAERVLVLQRKDLQVALFNKIADATRRYAEREGWDLILSTDMTDDVPDSLGLGETQAVLLGRRTFAVAPGIDVTNEVAQLMNNEYKR